MINPSYCTSAFSPVDLWSYWKNTRLALSLHQPSDAIVTRSKFQQLLPLKLPRCHCRGVKGSQRSTIWAAGFWKENTDILWWLNQFFQCIAQFTIDSISHQLVEAISHNLVVAKNIGKISIRKFFNHQARKKVTKKCGIQIHDITDCAGTRKMYIFNSRVSVCKSNAFHQSAICFGSWFVYISHRYVMISVRVNA